METPIGDNHKAYLARLQHTGEWLHTEQARLENELLHVMQQSQRVAHETIAFLRESYGIDALTIPTTLDTDRGVIVTPDDPSPASEQPSPTEPTN